MILEWKTGICYALFESNQTRRCLADISGKNAESEMHYEHPNQRDEEVGSHKEQKTFQQKVLECKSLPEDKERKRVIKSRNTEIL